MLDVHQPEVRLLSIGEEPEKGNQLTLEAHALLEGAEGLDFRGNTESRDLLAGAADVDRLRRFTGNVVLKLLEGTIPTVLEALREEITSSRRGKVGGSCPPRSARMRSRLDPDTYGGAYLLGLRGLAVSPTETRPGARSPTRSAWLREASSTMSSADSRSDCRKEC